MPKKNWTAITFDVNWDDGHPYDIGKLRVAIDKAIDEMGCEWTGYFDVESVTDSYNQE